MMKNLTTLQGAVNEIKKLIENEIKRAGTIGKNNLIRSQRPIKLLHNVVKAELINKSVNPAYIFPQLGESKGELSLAGFFKRKDQDICVRPNHVKEAREILDFDGILYGEEDVFGQEYTERILSINVRSQLSSSAKNFDTLYERTFAEALNLHLRCPKMVLGEFYMIAVNEYDSTAANLKKVKYKNISGVERHIEKYLLSFSAINNRRRVKDEHFKYERVCLLIVDFSKRIPKIYHTDKELIDDGLLPKDSKATIKDLSFKDFVSDLLHIHSDRFGTRRFK